MKYQGSEEFYNCNIAVLTTNILLYGISLHARSALEVM